MSIDGLQGAKGEIAQVTKDEIPGSDHGQDVMRSGLVVSREATDAKLQELTGKQIGDDLNPDTGLGGFVLIPRPGKSVLQLRMQFQDRGIVDQHPADQIVDGPGQDMSGRHLFAENRSEEGDGTCVHSFPKALFGDGVIDLLPPHDGQLAERARLLKCGLDDGFDEEGGCDLSAVALLKLGLSCELTKPLFIDKGDRGAVGVSRFGG